MSDALNFLLQKARRNTDGSLSVSRDLLKAVNKMTDKPKPKVTKKRRSSKKEDE
jgi:hypothetical protein